MALLTNAARVYTQILGKHSAISDQYSAISAVKMVSSFLRVFSVRVSGGKFCLDRSLYFDYSRNIGGLILADKPNVKDVARYADMLSAIGTETRLRIMRLLLTAHPDGLVVGEIGEDLEIPNSTLSHHLDKLKNEGLVCIQREGTFLRCTANTSALEELLGFLYAECCTRNKAVEPQRVVCCG